MRTPLLALALALVLATAGCGQDESDTVGVATPACVGEVAPPPEAQVQREKADLDADGRDDEVVGWTSDDGSRVQVVLADGGASEPAEAGPLLAVHDVDADGRAEVLVDATPPAAPPATPAAGGTVAGDRRAAVLVLDGCVLRPVEDPSGPLQPTYGTGPDRLTAAATLRCTDDGLEQVVSHPAPAPDFRLVETTRWVLTGGTAAAPTRTSERVAEQDDPALAARGEIVCG